MVFLSPAKINVHLGVGGLRQDGYHDICSWFLMVDLCDNIKIDYGAPGIDIRGNRDVSVENDLMAKAAKLFYAKVGLAPGCVIRIKKNIPIGAGLGGGSSNAATVLKGLNRLHSSPLDEKQLRELSLKLGSDVPFFLGHPSAIVTGRGEVIEEIRMEKSWWSLIVHPGFSIHTKEAYAWLDEARGENAETDRACGSTERQAFELTAANIRSMIESGREHWGFYNDFSLVLYLRYPVLKDICDLLFAEGAVHSDVSGSGSTCFGLFETYDEASKAALKLPDMRLWIKETLASCGSDVLE
jgi:4-diphosphocytidyl-2-C-methyl-D-erythritol kinase